jgi:RimJ/RimL family protein N-acetyltransferase
MVYRKNDRSNSKTVRGLSIKRYPERSVVDLEIIDTLKTTRDGGLMREIDKLFAKGYELWVGRLDGEMAGICWSRSGRNRTDYFVPLVETDATIMSCFVYPELRGRGIYPAMLQTMVNVLMDRDRICDVYIDCKSWNSSSIRGIRKAGFVPIGKAVRMVLFEHVWILWNRCKKTT